MYIQGGTCRKNDDARAANMLKKNFPSILRAFFYSFIFVSETKTEFNQD